MIKSPYTLGSLLLCETVPATGVANEEAVEQVPPSAGQLGDHLDTGVREGYTVLARNFRRILKGRELVRKTNICI